MPTYPFLSKPHPFGQFRYRDLQGGRIEIEPAWQARNLIEIHLSAGPGSPVNRTVTCHRAAAPAFQAAFDLIRRLGLGHLIETYDGLWVPRHKLWNPKLGLSNHSWGTAVDLNAATNPYGGEATQANRTLFEAAFKKASFIWGGNWKTKDGMHYELPRPSAIAKPVAPEPTPPGPRLIVAKPSGIPEPQFAYREIRSKFEGGKMLAAHDDLSRWLLGKPGDSRKFQPIREFLAEHSIPAEVSTKHLKDKDDPRTYVFVKG